MAISAQHTRFVTSEYVNPIPAEDLIKVAIKKQEMYDEGRNQIKQVYDNYGKLRATIKNENELKYFDQEMDKLHKNVQQNAGLDFSNIGNVEAVINLAKPFENDTYIRTALENGQEVERRQKELASMPKDQRNADNDLVYMYDAQKHIESGGLGEKIAKNKTYQSYIDIKARIREVEKEVPAEEYTDPKLYGGADGYLRMVEHKRKRREDIYRRAMEGMTPDEQNQLQIHAQANMYRLGNDVLYQNWVGYNKEERLIANQKRKESMQELARLKEIKKPTAEQLEQMKALDSGIKSYESTIAAANENVKMNPDDFDMGEYLPFFMKRQIDGIAGQLAFDNSKIELKENKVFMAQLEHNYDLQRIQAQGRESRTTELYKQNLDYVTQSGGSSNLLKGVANFIPNKITSKGSAAVDEAIAQIQANTKLTGSRKQQLVDQLTSMKEVYATAETQKGRSNMVVTINRGMPGEYTTSVGDFLTSNPIDLISSGSVTKVEVRQKAGGKEVKSAEQIQEESRAELQGEIDAKTNLYNTNKALFDLLYPKSSSATINLTPPPQRD
jgi:hypothetical protein